MALSSSGRLDPISSGPRGEHHADLSGHGNRPKRDMKDLWSKISNDPKDIDAMSKAALDPKLMVLSDWSRFTSEEYWKAIEDSKLLLLCAFSFPR